MTSEQFVALIEARLKEHGVKKVVPNIEVLSAAYRRAKRTTEIRRILYAAMEDDTDADIEVPDGLSDMVREKISGSTQSWDDAVLDIAG